MRRARTRKERRAKEQRAVRVRRLGAIAAIVVVICAGGALPGWLIVHELTKPNITIDPAGCSPDHQPEHIVVLIDQTDPMPPQWLAYTQQVMPQLAADPEMPTYGRLSVFGLDDNRAAPLAKIVSACKPPNPGEGSFLFDTQAVRSARQAEYDAFYAEKVQRAADAAGQSTTREISPILEGLRALQDYLLEHPADSTTLYVLSDMLQYTPNAPRFTHYGNYPSFADFSDTRAGAAVKAYLPVDTVIVLYVQRPGMSQHQTQTHRDFWHDYFTAAGVGAVEWVDDPIKAIESLSE